MFIIFQGSFDCVIYINMTKGIIGILVIPLFYVNHCWGLNMQLVTCAFPGCGKSTISKNAEQYGLRKAEVSYDPVEGVLIDLPAGPGVPVFDSDSSIFPKDNFPANYISHIQGLLRDFPKCVIMVSSHDNVREALREAGIAYTLVYPQRELKGDFLERYEGRGSPEAFVSMMDAKWNDFIDSCEADTTPSKHVLSEGENLVDKISEQLLQINSADLSQAAIAIPAEPVVTEPAVIAVPEVAEVGPETTVVVPAAAAADSSVEAPETIVEAEVEVKTDGSVVLEVEPAAPGTPEVSVEVAPVPPVDNPQPEVSVVAQEPEVVDAPLQASTFAGAIITGNESIGDVVCDSRGVPVAVWGHNGLEVIPPQSVATDDTPAEAVVAQAVDQVAPAPVTNAADTSHVVENTVEGAVADVVEAVIAQTVPELSETTAIKEAIHQAAEVVGDTAAELSGEVVQDAVSSSVVSQVDGVESVLVTTVATGEAGVVDAPAIADVIVEAVAETLPGATDCPDLQAVAAQAAEEVQEQVQEVIPTVVETAAEPIVADVAVPVVEAPVEVTPEPTAPVANDVQTEVKQDVAQAIVEALPDSAASDPDVQQEVLEVAGEVAEQAVESAVEAVVAGNENHDGEVVETREEAAELATDAVLPIVEEKDDAVVAEAEIASPLDNRERLELIEAKLEMENDLDVLDDVVARVTTDEEIAGVEGLEDNSEMLISAASFIQQKYGSQVDPTIAGMESFLGKLKEGLSAIGKALKGKPNPDSARIIKRTLQQVSDAAKVYTSPEWQNKQTFINVGNAKVKVPAAFKEVSSIGDVSTVLDLIFKQVDVTVSKYEGNIKQRLSAGLKVFNKYKGKAKDDKEAIAELKSLNISPEMLTTAEADSGLKNVGLATTVKKLPVLNKDGIAEATALLVKLSKQINDLWSKVESVQDDMIPEIDLYESDFWNNHSDSPAFDKLWDAVTYDGAAELLDIGYANDDVTIAVAQFLESWILNSVKAK